MEAIDGSFIVSFILSPLQAPCLWRLSFEAAYHLLPESFWLMSSWWLQTVCSSPLRVVWCSISVFLTSGKERLFIVFISLEKLFSPRSSPTRWFEGHRAWSVHALAATCCLEEQLRRLQLWGCTTAQLPLVWDAASPDSCMCTQALLPEPNTSPEIHMLSLCASGTVP